jgi:hypothetical protein
LYTTRHRSDAASGLETAAIGQPARIRQRSVHQRPYSPFPLCLIFPAAASTVITVINTPVPSKVAAERSQRRSVPPAPARWPHAYPATAADCSVLHCGRFALPIWFASSNRQESRSRICGGVPFPRS